MSGGCSVQRTSLRLVAGLLKTDQLQHLHDVDGSHGIKGSVVGQKLT
jgi:hypothetical protein